jgi:hypothetical protein
MAAGMVIPCPLCQQRIAVPSGGGPTAAQAAQYQQWHMQHAYTQAAVMDQQAGGGLFPNAATPVIVEVGGALVVVGPQVDASGRWHLRGVDPGTRQVRWEVGHGLPYRTPPEVRSIVARDGRIYVAHEGVLVAIDGASGRGLWQARLSQRICRDSDAEPIYGDGTELREVGGAVIVKTEDDVLHAFARDTGVPLWQRKIEQHAQVHGNVLHVRCAYRHYELVNPLDGRTAARFAVSDAVLTPAGLVTAPDEGDKKGVALVDPATGQERWFVSVDMGLRLNEGVAVAGDELLVPFDTGSAVVLMPIRIADGAARKSFFGRLFGGTPATRSLPWKDSLDGLWTVGGALAVCMQLEEGKRFALLDPRTMAVRHDSGVVSDASAPGARIGPGVLAYVFGDESKTVRMVEASGRPMWERTFRDVDDVAFRGGFLILRANGAPIEIVDVASGQTRGTFAR